MIRNHSTGSGGNRFERNQLPSVTVPDRTISLRDMITRHNSGGRVKSFDPVYLGDTNIIPMGFERMDLPERAQFLKDLPQFIADSRGRLQTMRQHREYSEKVEDAKRKRSEFEALKAELDAEGLSAEGNA